MSILNKIKALFEATTPATFADVKTKEGAILRIEGDLKEGAIVSHINTDGSVTIANNAEHTLEDGTIISTDAEGKITKVVAVEAAKDEVAPEEKEKLAEDVPVEEAPKEEVKVEEDKMVAMEMKVSELEAAITMIAEQLKTIMDAPNVEAEMADIKKENKTLKKENKTLAAEPASPAINFKKVEAIEKVSNKKVQPESEMLKRIMALKEANN